MTMREIIRNLAQKSRRTEIFWRYGFNFLPTLNYRFGAARGASPGEITRRVVENLDREGIFITSVDELLGDKNIYTELETEVEKLTAARCEELDRLRPRAADSEKIGEKTFNVELLGKCVEFEPESVFARFALQEKLLNIANAYFKMLVKLRYYNVWLTFADRSAAPRESQLWHFDREDNYILKVFVYLKDVDKGAGPFTYAPKTHRKGTLRGKEPEYFLEKNVRRTTDEQMSQVVARENWITATGKRGTIVFADTRGYHKGGEAKTSDRLMFTCMFTSPASESKRLMNFSAISPFDLSKSQLAALEID